MCQIINSYSNGYFQVFGIAKAFVKDMETGSTTPRVFENFFHMLSIPV